MTETVIKNMTVWNGKVLEAQSHGLSDEEVAECFTSEQALNFFAEYSAFLRKPLAQFALATGNVVDGFEFYGTFDSELEAVEFANHDADLPESWHVVTIQPCAR